MQFLAAAVSELLVWTVLLGGLWSRLAAAEGGLASSATPSQRSPPRTVAEVVAPPVPEAENAAPLYLAAVAVLEAEEVWATNLAEVAAEVYRSVFSPSGRRSFLAWIEGMRVPEEHNRQPSVGDAYEEFAGRLGSPAVTKALDLVAAASVQPKCGFRVDYSQGPETPLPHLGRLRLLGGFLGAVGGLAVERGDAESAWECVLWQLRLADSLRDEPLLISQLVRTAILEMGLSGLHQAAPALPSSPEVRMALDRHLDGSDGAAPWVLALDGERLIMGEWLADQPRERLLGMLQAGGAGELQTVTPEQLADGREAHARAMLRLAELAARPYHEVRFELDALSASFSMSDPLVKALLPAVGRVSCRAAQAQALTRITRIGIRLVQHREAHGAYPTSLAALDLADIPAGKQLDPFTGKALLYCREGDGFVLYSVGQDGHDDGGRPRSMDADSPQDIVWRVEN